MIFIQQNQLNHITDRTKSITMNSHNDMNPQQSLKRQRASDNIQLTNLNDCLLHLFRYLPLADLNSIGLTCHYLRGLVNMTYIYHDKLKCLNVIKIYKYKSHGYNNNIEMIKAYFQKFGKLIEHIEFDRLYHRKLPAEFVNQIFAFIAICCSDKFKSFNVLYIILQG